MTSSSQMMKACSHKENVNYLVIRDTHPRMCVMWMLTCECLCASIHICHIDGYIVTFLSFLQQCDFEIMDWIFMIKVVKTANDVDSLTSSLCFYKLNVGLVWWSGVMLDAIFLSIRSSSMHSKNNISHFKRTMCVYPFFNILFFYFYILVLYTIFVKESKFLLRIMDISTWFDLFK